MTCGMCHIINPDFHSSNKNRATQQSSKSKRKSNFRSISQLMKTPPSNKNRYSFLQCSQHDEGECDDDDNLQETYASVAARQNSNLHSTHSPGNIRVVPPTTSRLTPRNAGLLDGVKIGPPTRTRVTPGNTVSVGNKIVG